MKKALSLIMTAIMLFSFATMAFAVDYDQIFPEGQNGSSEFRIPALYTLNDGSVLAVADARYGHGSDSPNNIDTLAATSADGYTGWKYQLLNYFGDYADGTTDVNSASFIDTAIAQSVKTGRIFTIVDAQPAGCGYLQCKRGTGFIEINGKDHLLLTKGNSTDSLDTFNYYVGDFVNGIAPIIRIEDSYVTVYSMDLEHNLYKDGKPLTMLQKGSENVTVQQNVFYKDAELKCYSSTMLWLRTSDDNGKTWNAPVNISGQVKKSDETFLGICPGRGAVINLPDGRERIIFMVYDNAPLNWNETENVSTIYSDDNGVTWQRGAETFAKMTTRKTSESQLVKLNNGVLRLYAHNGGGHIAYADSSDYGHSWSDFTADLDLSAMANCMCSFINTSKTINGKPVILGSFPSNTSARADGVIKVGLINSDNSVDWISTYYIKSSFYAYSCMTELRDGKFAILYEDEVSHLTYMIFNVADDGSITEINNPNNENGAPKLTVWQKIVNFFKKIFTAIGKFFGMY